jgi:PAS domain-containing protein
MTGAPVRSAPLTTGRRASAPRSGVSPIDDEKVARGVGGVLVVCNDVTDRHRAFEAVAASEERLRLALSGAVIGTWDWHVQTGVVFGDEPFARLYGMDPAELRAGTSARAFL